jgi:hypothetical protein
MQHFSRACFRPSQDFKQVSSREFLEANMFFKLGYTAFDFVFSSVSTWVAHCYSPFIAAANSRHDDDQFRNGATRSSNTACG